MPLYSYRCGKCGAVDVYHPFAEVDDAHTCPTCGQRLRRVLTPAHHWWPANYRPGFEDSGQRMFLDPERQAKMRDDLAVMKGGSDDD